MDLEVQRNINVTGDNIGIHEQNVLQPNNEEQVNFRSVPRRLPLKQNDRVSSQTNSYVLLDSYVKSPILFEKQVSREHIYARK